MTQATQRSIIHAKKLAYRPKLKKGFFFHNQLSGELGAQIMKGQQLRPGVVINEW